MYTLVNDSAPPDLDDHVSQTPGTVLERQRLTRLAGEADPVAHGNGAVAKERPDMFPWERAAQQSRGVALEADFTPEQIERLRALRQRVGTYGAQMKLGINDRRLKFACWLVEHGRLSEYF